MQTIKQVERCMYGVGLERGKYDGRGRVNPLEGWFENLSCITPGSCIITAVPGVVGPGQIECYGL